MYRTRNLGLGIALQCAGILLVFGGFFLNLTGLLVCIGIPISMLGGGVFIWGFLMAFVWPPVGYGPQPVGYGVAPMPAPMATGQLVVKYAGRDLAYLPFSPGAQYTVGRSSQSHVVIPDPKASSHHAVLEIGQGGIVVLRDLASTNGTFIHGSRVSGAARIQPGSQITFGNAVVTLVW